MNTMNENAEVEHGTYAGWNWHRKNDVPICKACRDAATEYQRQRRKVNKSHLKDSQRRTRALTILSQRHQAEFHEIMQDLKEGVIE